LIAAVLLIAPLLYSCTLLAPTPTDEQILQAVTVSNEVEAEPLVLVYEEMLVPHRSPGRAAAVLWVPDKSIQRNFIVAYDKKEKTFYVKSYITLVRGEDGVYRDEQP
jgi:hypothetical protein